MDQKPDLTGRVLGETPGIVQLGNRAAVHAACALMAAQAVQQLRILSHDLDAGAYDHTAFLASVRRLALCSPRTPVEILLFDAEPAIHQGNRLIELSRQLPSRIQIRRVPEDFRHQVTAYLLADDQGYVLRPLAEVLEGTADFAAPLQVRHMHDEFEYIWERATQPTEILTFGRGL